VSRYEWGRSIIGTREKGHVVYEWEGQDKWVVFREDAEKGWYYVVGVTKEEVLGAVGHMERVSWLIVSAFAVVFIWFLATILRRQLAPLRFFSEAFLRLGQGDLTRGINLERGDELGVLARDFNAFLEEIRGLLGQVRSRADSVSSGATEISATAEELAATAEEQNQQTQSVVVSVTQLSATATDIAKSVDLTSSSAERSDSLSKEGQSAVQQSLDGFKAIDTVSKQLGDTIDSLVGSVQEIGGILDVIRDVADQTNLLALNAAIEAARAGDAGRGFAVVADEVRKLAERTAGATGEIANLIQRIQGGAGEAQHAMEMTRGEVVRGNQVSLSVMAVMEKVAQSGADILHETRSVAAAVTEETATIDEINQNLQGMGTAAEESARAVHDVAQATESLARDAEAMKSLVERFKL